jgi:hypothetical protein
MININDLPPQYQDRAKELNAKMFDLIQEATKENIVVIEPPKFTYTLEHYSGWYIIRKKSETGIQQEGWTIPFKLVNGKIVRSTVPHYDKYAPAISNRIITGDNFPSIESFAIWIVEKWSKYAGEM